MKAGEMSSLMAALNLDILLWSVLLGVYEGGGSCSTMYSTGRLFSVKQGVVGSAGRWVVQNCGRSLGLCAASFLLLPDSRP